MIYSAARAFPPPIIEEAAGLVAGDFTFQAGSLVTGGALTQDGLNVTLTGGTGDEWPVAAWVPAADNTRVTALLSFTGVANEALNRYVGLILRASWSGTDLNGYLAAIKLRIGEGQEAHIRRFYVNSDQLLPLLITSASLADAGTSYFSTDFWIKAETEGTALRMKAWLDGGTEPASFLATTDATYTTGGVGIVGFDLQSASEITLKSLLVESI